MTMGSLVESTNKSGETEIKGLVGCGSPPRGGSLMNGIGVIGRASVGSLL